MRTIIISATILLATWGVSIAGGGDCGPGGGGNGDGIDILPKGIGRYVDDHDLDLCEIVDYLAADDWDGTRVEFGGKHTDGVIVYTGELYVPELDGIVATVDVMGYYRGRPFRVPGYVLPTGNGVHHIVDSSFRSLTFEWEDTSMRVTWAIWLDPLEYGDGDNADDHGGLVSESIGGMPQPGGSITY